MILRDRQAIFIHIARTGGTSIEVALIGRDFWQVSPDTKHLSARQARAEYGGETYDNFFKFSFVRNPWDRLVSMWSTGWWFDSTRFRGRPPVDFATFAREVQPHPHEISGTLLMSETLDDDVDFIGRFENLEHDFQVVCRKLGREGCELPHSERREHGHYSAYYDDHTVDVVAQRWAADIERFEYSFQRETDPDPSLFSSGG